ncbi:A-kinase anchor protein 12b isoform X2 [Xyrichtys novacula]|uniref:A-kinase anchor protein 12b isoform X2 n=1 Tax=Xyrichtys novacula TaxID=13765 RepID=A0AAV1GZ12_XYRNO|nr:A-kinase anchor protein 12b isoform X2 [Xyrichtys novacula]
MLGTITLTVGQPDGVSVAQKEEAPETMDVQDEVTPQVNGEKLEKESPDGNDISAVEENAAEEKPGDANEVGFKKIFRFVGFKFTLKKDKSEEKDPVKLLTVKDKEGEEVVGSDEATKEGEAVTMEEKSPAEDKEADRETTSIEAEVTKDNDKAEAADAPAEGAAEPTEETVKAEGAEKEGEASPPAQETTLSPFRRLFSGGLFSNLRKKTSIKKTKEEEEKEAAVEEEAVKTEETAAAVEEKEEKEVEKETKKEEAPATPKEEKSEPKEETPACPEEAKSETAPEPEVPAETPAPATTTDETEQEEEKGELNAEEEKAPAEVTTEAELLSSQEKAKPQGSPLKKLFTGAGLKKLSTKKQKAKKDVETKPTESGEQAAEQFQSSTESTEAPKAESGPSSPEESGEHVLAVEVNQIESSQETEGEVTSDGEKKKEGIIAWTSFKKLVTPKKRVKRSSESDDEATGEKLAKSATLSSTESAPLADKSVEEGAKEEKQAEVEPKTETTEKLLSSTEEPKKKIDTSVSWEALMCMGGPKKRTRKTSDSDDEETKIEEEVSALAVEGEQEGKMEAAVVTSQSTEHEGEVVSSPEPLSSPPERESTWDTLKRMVMPKNKTKSEDKTEDGGEQVLSDSEAPKDESTFSLRKFLPGRRKKKAEKQASTEQCTGDEDSDTPAVVPLSEYEESEQEVLSEPEPEPALVQTKVSAEDRSPSWIPAVVEHIEDKLDELSDIPEEAENAATPKSVDTDITEDDTEDDAAFAAKVKALSERRLSTAEVKPIDQAPSAETTPVPQGPNPESAKEVLECIQAHVSEIPIKTSVAVESVPVEVASVKIEFEPPIETAEAKTNAILEPHTCAEAVAICTGLGTEEIAKVALQKPAEPIMETVAVICDALGTEVSQEEKQPCVEEASVTEDEVLRAQVHQVETTELEPAVETLACEVTNVQAADENIEPEIEKVGVISTVLEGSEIVQPATVSENSPKTVVVGAITPTSETAICTESVVVTEPTIETKEVKMVDTEVSVPKEVQKVTEEFTVEASKVTEPEVLEGPSEEAPVITETVVLATSPILEIEQVKISEPVGVEPVQVQEIEEEKTVEATTVPAAESEISAANEEVSETIEEIKEDVPKDSEFEAQSKVIAEVVIQDAVDKVSEDTAKPKKPTTPSTMPALVKATATTEKEIEISSEGPVITDTPVPLVCEKPKSPQTLHVAMEVIATIPVEVVDSIYASGEEEMKPGELKKTVEVNVSEETVVVEEVMEIKESPTGEELDEVKEEEGKDNTEVQEPAEVVEPVSVEAEAEAPTEEKKEKVFEIHTPVQVFLQTAQMMEEPSVEEEVVVEFDSNGLSTEERNVEPKIPALENKLSTLPENLAEAASAKDSAPSKVAEEAANQPETEKTPSTTVKCAEVMAQVIEVIEEAVKEIEPVSTEITAAS